VPHRSRGKSEWDDFTLLGEAHVAVSSDVDCTREGYGVIHFEGVTDHARVYARDDE
jgi:hypothetical protein